MAVGAENEGTKHLLIMNVTALTDLRGFQDIFIDERYRIDYKIGEGEFGLVYAGRGRHLQRAFCGRRNTFGNPRANAHH
ncbi:hypothetical protein MY5147_009652 [Beauveria neobassiana]